MARYSDLPTAAREDKSAAEHCEDAATHDQTGDTAQIQTESPPTSSFESAVEQLCRPRTIAETDLTIQSSEDMARFDEYWESLVPRIPVAPRIEPLARMVSLVPVKQPGEDVPVKPQTGDAFSTWLNQMLAEN
jgi:hypothetical protein